MKKTANRSGKWFIPFFLCLFLSPMLAFAQTGQVRGVVTDQSGQPAVGVSVVVSGTTNGTLTGADGAYALNGVPSDATLEFSCIGLVSQTVSVGGRGVINVTMDEDVEMLEETVVIGYGTVKKSDLTGAVSVVKTEEFKNRTVTSIGDALQGAAAGVMVRSDGNMGGLPSIQIRGTGNLTNIDPLYVIDGVPTDNNIGFNVNDIASVQILKDASAAAIYGSRAANGVIIITTKTGQEGRAKIEFSSQLSVRNHKRLDFIKGDDWRSMYTQAFELGRQTGTTADATPNWWKNDTDWQDELYKTGLQQEYNLAVSGGSKDSKYRISLGYLDNNGSTIGNHMTRLTANANSQFTRGIVTLGESVQFGKTDFDRHNGGLGDAVGMNPTVPVYDDVYGKNGWGLGNRAYAYTNAYNVVAAASPENNGRWNNDIYLRASFWTELKLLKWLTYKLNLGGTLNDSDSHSWTTGYEYALGFTDVASDAQSSASRAITGLIENTLNFNKQLGKHNIAGVLGQSYQDTETRSLSSESHDLIKTAGGTYLKNVSTGITQAAGSGTNSQHRLISYFGRVNYDYDGRYLFQATVRRDGTSRFASGYRWGTFPSVSAAWRVSKEKFYNIPWMNDLKIRANYGTLGSQNVGNYDWMSLINSYASYAFNGGSTFTPGQAITDAANATISWEKKITTNIGVDAAFFNNRLQASLEWYDSQSKDVLYKQSILKTVGSKSNPTVNSASLSNKGVELTVTYNDRINEDWSYSVSLNLSHNDNKLLGLGYGVDNYDATTTLSKVGHPIGLFYLIHAEGLYQTDAEAKEHGVNNQAKAGDVRFTDVDGSGSITNGDRQLITDKSPWPKLEAGLNITLNYKNWDAQFYGFGMFGRWVYNGTRASMDNLTNQSQKSVAYFENQWSEKNKHNDVWYPRTSWGYTSNDIASDRWLEKGDFFKFSTISIGYNYVPKGIISTVITGARFYVTAQNLLCLTKYTGYDPDFTAGLFTPGNGSTRLPNPTSFIFGINLTF